MFNELVDLSERDYGLLIKNYIAKSKYPPNSPYDLIAVIENYDDKFTAWEKVNDTYRNTTSDLYFKQSIKKNYPELYDLVKNWNTDAHREEHDKFGNSVFGFYFYKKFINAYDEMLKSKKLIKINGEIQNCIANLMQLENKNESDGFRRL